MKNSNKLFLTKIGLFCVFFVSLFASTKCLATDSIKNKYVFVMYNQEDVLALLPVVDRLHKMGEIPQILAIGPSITLLKQLPKFSRYYIHTTKAIGPAWEYDEVVNNTLVNELVNEFPAAKYVISGCSSTAQGQLLKEFSKKSETFAYWHYLNTEGFYPTETGDDDDTFEPGMENTFLEVAFAAQSRAKYLLLTSKAVAENQKFTKKRVRRSMFVVGHPLLDSWSNAVPKVNVEDVKKKLGIEADEKVFLLTSGDHQLAFDAFKYAAETIQAYAQKNPCHLLVLLKDTNDLSELKILQDMNIKDIHLVNNKGPVTPVEAVAIADITLTYDSPLALYATAANKKVIHCISKNVPYTNILIDKQITKRVSEISEFCDVCKTPFESKDLFTELRIPKKSVTSILEAIKKSETTGAKK